MDIQLILMPERKLIEDFERLSKWMDNKIKKQKERASTKNKNTWKLISNINRNRRIESSLQLMWANWKIIQVFQIKRYPKQLIMK